MPNNFHAYTDYVVLQVWKSLEAGEWLEENPYEMKEAYPVAHVSGTVCGGRGWVSCDSVHVCVSVCMHICVCVCVCVCVSVCVHLCVCMCV